MILDRAPMPPGIEKTELTLACDVLCWVLRHDHNQTFAENIARHAEAHGVAPERILYAPNRSPEEHLARWPRRARDQSTDCVTTLNELPTLEYPFT